jgi:hypothetical protein
MRTTALHIILYRLLDILPTGDLNQIAAETASLYTNIKYLCFGLAGLFGLVGGLKIYHQWQLHGKHHMHIEAEITALISGCIFFLLAAGIIQAVLL